MKNDAFIFRVLTSKIRGTKNYSETLVSTDQTSRRHVLKYINLNLL